MAAWPTAHSSQRRGSASIFVVNDFVIRSANNAIVEPQKSFSTCTALVEHKPRHCALSTGRRGQTFSGSMSVTEVFVAGELWAGLRSQAAFAGGAG